MAYTPEQFLTSLETAILKKASFFKQMPDGFLGPIDIAARNSSDAAEWAQRTRDYFIKCVKAEQELTPGISQNDLMVRLIKDPKNKRFAFLALNTKTIILVSEAELAKIENDGHIAKPKIKTFNLAEVNKQIKDAGLPPLEKAQVVALAKNIKKATPETRLHRYNITDVTDAIVIKEPSPSSSAPTEISRITERGAALLLQYAKDKNNGGKRNDADCTSMELVEANRGVLSTVALQEIEGSLLYVTQDVLGNKWNEAAGELMYYSTVLLRRAVLFTPAGQDMLKLFSDYKKYPEQRVALKEQLKENPAAKIMDEKDWNRIFEKLGKNAPLGTPSPMTVRLQGKRAIGGLAEIG